jgi:hypothetical protein
MVWDTVKNWVGQKNVSLKLGDAMQLEEENVNSTTAQDCASYCKHAICQEEEYLATEVATDKTTKLSSA